MRRIVYAVDAKASLRNIFDHILAESKDVATAQKQVGRLLQKVARLALLPGTLGHHRPEFGEGIRSLPFRNYIIFFRYGDDRLYIVAIIHGHQDPDRYFIHRK